MTDRNLTVARHVTDGIDGFEALGRCKHGDEVAVEDRTAEDREAGQQGFEAFSESEAQEDN